MGNPSQHSQTPATFAGALRAARHRAGVTLSELARVLSVSVPYLHDVEHGRRHPLTEARAQLAAEYLGAPELVHLARQARAAVDVSDLSPEDRAAVAAYADTKRQARSAA